MRKIRISVGIPAYNEEKNIVELLTAISKQKLQNAVLEKIFVINDGSTDSTMEKVEKFIKSEKLKGKIELINRKKRKGKWAGINIFLKKAKSPVLILESADNLPKEDCFELLARHFYDKRIGIVASHIVPLNDKNTYFGFAAHLIYELHHEISREHPKFGELIAFRNHIIKCIPPTMADEEDIAIMIRKKGYLTAYEPNAIVYNKAPENLSDFIRQRRRNYCSHIDVRERTKYSPFTMTSFYLVKKLADNITIRNFFKVASVTFLEGFSRILGRIDYIDYKVYRKQHVKWRPIESVKKLK